MQTQAPCSRCQGKGRIIESPCPSCGGQGRIRKTEQVGINIPAGIDDGQVINITGKGNAGVNGGPAGDLQIQVTVRPHPLFERDGFNIWYELPITYAQAALGAEIDVPTLEKPVKYRFPEGTQPGQVFALKGQGVQHLRGGGKGDLYVTAVVEIPKKLTEKQKDLLQQFDGTVSERQYEKKKSFFDKLKDAFS